MEFAICPECGNAVIPLDEGWKCTTDECSWSTVDDFYFGD